MRLTDVDELLKTIPLAIKREIENAPTKLVPVNTESMSVKEMKKLRDSLDSEIRKIEDEKLKNEIEARKPYVGKCFQCGDIEKTFYKVISQYGEYTDMVTVLKFDMPIRYKFREIYDSNLHRHKYCYNFEFQNELVGCVDIGFLDCNCEEISEEEFEKGAYSYLRQLLFICGRIEAKG